MEKSERIRRDMMELWKETFHDSSRYIDIVFDNYFTLENAYTRYHENRLIASLLCIPYEFRNLARDGKWSITTGLYLCGLATRPEFRKRGIMSELMSEVERDARERGFSMTFLIPADSHLREYYRKKGYRDNSFRMLERLTENEDPGVTFLNIYSISELKSSRSFLEKLAGWCHELELEDYSRRILHSKQDMMAIMEENENSIFLTKEPLDLKKPNLVKVVGVAFPEYHQDDEGAEKIVIADLYVGDCENNEYGKIKDESPLMNKVKSTIARYFSGKRVELKVSNDGMQLSGREVEQYAMGKSLDPTACSDKSMDQIFKISLMLD